MTATLPWRTRGHASGSSRPIGPGWTPIEIANAHYQACDELALSVDEVSAVGQRVGGQLQGAFVSGAKKVRDRDFDLWSAIGPLHRVWARIYQVGSVQIVKLGPKEQLTELRGFPLARYR
jgi:hypothetical protein